MKPARSESGPSFTGGKVRWGEVEVSRESYDLARSLLTAAPLPQDNLQEVPAVAPAAHRPAKHAMRGKRRATAAADRNEVWMTMGDVAVAASVHYETVRKWIGRGKLPAARTKTGMIRIKRSDFIEFMGGAG
jgi:excisionase family DNA binding protein